MWTGGWTQEKGENSAWKRERSRRARAHARGYGVALRADLWFHDAASNNRRVTKWTFYRIIVLLRDAAPTAQ